MKALTTIRKSEPASQKHGAHRTNPTKRAILFLLTALCSCSLLAQLHIKGRVVDAETGEPLPYANVYADDKNGTLTNADGYFHLLTSEGARVRFTYIGYQQMTRPAQQAQGTLRMKPLSKDLGQVTVRPYDPAELVREIIRKLDESYKKGRGERGLYFYRTTFTNGRRNELVEAFMKANSAVNLRKMAITSGVTGSDITDDNARLGITYTNVHRVMQVGARTYDSYRWESCIKPFDKVSVFKRHYEAKAISLGQGEEEIIRIDFKEKPGSPDRKGKGLMVGTAYVRAADKCLLRFDGNVLYQFMQAGLSRVPEDIKFSMQYDYSRGFAELSSLSIEGGGEFQPNVLSHLSTLLYRTILFHIPNDSLERQKEYRLETDMMAAVQKAGYDSQLWNRYEVIRRTEKEERIVFGENLMAHRRTKAKDGQDYIPHMDSTENPRLSELLQRHKRFATLIPQEKLYVHMDNTCYFQGDTIWFAAYSRSTDYGAPSQLSKVLYVELLNNDGYLVERKLIEMHNGRGNGFFALDKPVQYSGFYELRAYTRWQLNWGAFEHPHSKYAKRWFLSKQLRENFYRDYEKLYSRVFPVYDKPGKEGSFEHKMTLRTMRRYFRKDPDKRELKLSFYPEGGDLVAGVPCRVAFEATWDDGQWTEGHLYIGNDSVPVTNRGRGTFVFTPIAGKKQEAVFKTADGKRKKAELPKPEERGVAMQVRQGTDSVSVISLQVAGGIAPDSLAISLMHEGCLEYFRPLSGSACTFSIPHHNLPAGVHQASVFDTEGKVWADRLFFVRKRGFERPSLEISSRQTEYDPYEKIELDIRATDTTKAAKWERLSIAVRDEYHADKTFDNGTILTEMLLASEVKGFIPEPGWFFEEDNAERRDALDLLMMTQGWRRFDWQQMALPDKWEEKHPKEKTQMLDGIVYKTSEWKNYKQEFFRDEHGRTPTATEIQNRKIRELATDQLKMPEPETIGYEKEEREFLEGGADASGFILSGNPRNEAIVQMEMVQPGTINRYAKDDQETKNGKFFLTMPRYHGECVLFIDATDKKKWKRNKHFSLTQTEEEFTERMPLKRRKRIKENPSSFHITINFPYPRFVK
ncbi:MAG: carboxypeptidase-like regulatory domain-containing protein, partial [Bacteroidaceae bacterium]|nr:carboxypeptidase-like regulatory domain-containing protein [Bacteroidaceae bacterium]